MLPALSLNPSYIMNLFNRQSLYFLCWMMGCRLGLGARQDDALGHTHIRNMTVTTLSTALVDIQDKFVAVLQEEDDFPYSRKRKWERKAQQRPFGITGLPFTSGGHSGRPLSLSQPLSHSLHCLRGGDQPAANRSSAPNIVHQFMDSLDKVDEKLDKAMRFFMWNVIFPLLVLTFLFTQWYALMALSSAARECICQCPHGFDPLSIFAFHNGFGSK
jgi:hypothetical protein